MAQNRERIYLVGCLGKGSGRQIFPITANNRQIDDIQRPETNTITARYEATGTGSYIIENKLDAQEIRVKTNNKKGYEIAVEGDTINYQNLKSKTRRGRVGKQIAQTLDSGGEQAVIGNFGNSVGKENQDAFTLRSANPNGVIINQSIRRLTPIECERLQGFPDNWTRHGQELGEISDSQRYKMCGNAVTVDVVEAVAKKIKESL